MDGWESGICEGQRFVRGRDLGMRETGICDVQKSVRKSDQWGTTFFWEIGSCKRLRFVRNRSVKEKVLFESAWRTGICKGQRSERISDLWETEISEGHGGDGLCLGVTESFIKAVWCNTGDTLTRSYPVPMLSAVVWEIWWWNVCGNEKSLLLKGAG